MGRKSDKSKSKLSPDKRTSETSTRRSSRQRRHRRSPSTTPEPVPERHAELDKSEQLTPTMNLTSEISDRKPDIISDDNTLNMATKSNSNSNSGDEKTEPLVWQVKSSETSSDTGEIQKLKICLQRPSSTPERLDRSPRGDRSHKMHRSSSSQDAADSSEERHKRSKSKRRDSEDNKDKDTVPVHKNSETNDTDESKTAQVIDPPSDTTTTLILNEVSKVDEIHGSVSQDTESDVNLNLDSEISCNIESSDQNHEQSNESESIVEIPVDNIQSPDVVQENSSAPEETYTKDNITVEENQECIPIPEPDAPESEQSEPVSQDLKMIVDCPEIPDTESSIISKDLSKSSEKINGSDSSEGEIRDKKTVKSEVQVEPSGSTTPDQVRSTTPDIDKTFIPSKKNVQETSGKESKVPENASTETERMPRKRRWGSKKSTSNNIKKPTLVAISTDSLKNLISDVKPLSMNDVQLEEPVEIVSEVPEKKIIADDLVGEDITKPTVKEEIPVTSPVDVKPSVRKERSRKHSENDKTDGHKSHRERHTSHRKISIVMDENKAKEKAALGKNKPSEILFITNLVRPFTVMQLKGLLARTGKIVENGFWIDNIKSKCYVHFENEDQAVETRHALHGVRWPASNPKCLHVAFATEEEMSRCVTNTAPPADAAKTPAYRDKTVEAWIKDQNSREDRLKEKDGDRKTVVREWDMGKQDPGMSPDIFEPNNSHMVAPLRERERDHGDNRGINRDKIELDRDPRDIRKRRSRSVSPARKFKKKEEEAPSKRLDDLFRKTKIVPCLYWLPLSPEQISVKEEMRRQHMAEHERRKEEMRRLERERMKERERNRTRSDSRRDHRTDRHH